MEETLLRLYDRMAGRRAAMWTALAVLTAVLAAAALRLDLKEDITDFLPIDAESREALSAYREVAAGDRIVVLCEAVGDGAEAAGSSVIIGGDATGSVAAERAAAATARVVAAMDGLAARIAEADTAGWLAGQTLRLDADAALDAVEFAYAHLPLLLRAEDYAALGFRVGDTLTAAERAHNAAIVAARLESTRRAMTAPSAVGPAADLLLQDPLGLFAPVGERLAAFRPDLGFEVVDGYLFAPDGQRAYATLASPFGGSETAGNGALVALLEQAAAEQEAAGGVTITLTGAPVIAVTNARQIRQDSLVAMLLSAVLILALLLFAFRSVRPLVLIAAATAFGFLFALGCLGAAADSLSVIVLGIAAVIIGIAVNYPLHFVHHASELRRAPRPGGPVGRRALADLCRPLLIGNVTTVGAFLTLVPLDAVAIRHLGLFSALMLAGTIGFVLVFLPHLTGAPAVPMPVRPADSPRRAAEEAPRDGQPQRRGEGRTARIVRSPWSLAAVAVVTLALAWPAAQTSFDTDLSHINYMTPRQRADLMAWEALQGRDGGTVTVCILGDVEALTPALDSLLRAGTVLRLKNPADFLPSEVEQRRRLAAWQHFCRDLDMEAFDRAARAAGFTDEAFADFRRRVRSAAPAPMAADGFAPLTATALAGCVAPDGRLMAQASVPASEAAAVEALLRREAAGRCTVFDLTSLHAGIAERMAADFNYIGLACGLIVFLFLWASFGRVELAAVAFLPMAVGWTWILGLMHLCGLQFNIVNIILATFIFGQGDDYTIFITEGLLRDRRTGSSALPGYRRSVLLSAALMTAGIGALALARHPAMRSLGQVTLVGMSVVVAMAWLLPPMLLHWIERLDAPLRRWLDRRTATVAVLVLMGVGAGQAQAPAELRDAAGLPVASPDAPLADWQSQILELVDVEELSEAAYEDLIETLTDLGLSAAEADTATGPSRRVRQQLILRADRCLSQREGFRHPTAERRNDNKAYLGDPWHETVRYRLEAGDRWRAAVTLDKDAGERYGDGAVAAYLERMAEAGCLRRLVVGDYRIALGCGLVLNQRFTMGKQLLAAQFFTGQRRLSGHASTEEYNHMRGVAAELSLGRGWQLLPFVSCKWEGGAVERDTLTSLRTDGMHRTRREASQRRLSWLTQAGFRLGRRGDWYDVGLNLRYLHSELPYHRPLRRYNAHWFRGRNLGGASLDFHAQRYGLTLRGEAAVDDRGAPALLAALAGRIARSQWRWTALGRLYSNRYRQMQAAAVGESSALQGERGLLLAAEGEPWPHGTLRLTADLFRLTTPQYGIYAPSAGYELTARAAHVRPRWEASLHYRLKVKQKNDTETPDVPDDLTHYLRHTLDGVLTLRPLDALRLRTQVRTRTYSQQNLGGYSFGYAVAQSVACTLPLPRLRTDHRREGARRSGDIERVKSEGNVAPDRPDATPRRALADTPPRLTADVQLTYFDTDDYDTRVYLSERQILYGYGLPMLYGRGLRLSATLQAAVSARLTLEGKWALTNYDAVSHIGTGLQQIRGNNRHDLWLQARWRF